MQEGKNDHDDCSKGTMINYAENTQQVPKTDFSDLFTTTPSPNQPDLFPPTNASNSQSDSLFPPIMACQFDSSNDMAIPLQPDFSLSLTEVNTGPSSF
ncbi:hypothetical protein TRICI_006481 [Trichomonascus ciferrii]|uniref:Uncharacterized protein n=1 Tax=Trichomonascus ciferrii TaxID=44093 RepID=A0A642UNR6_9ASCO|nr:hypothetical protein TRICI_006481 [Trichomonascus ciferrii]